MSKTPNRLGRGLSAIIRPREVAVAAAPEPETPTRSEPPAGPFQHLPIDRIRPNRRQPRTDFPEPSLQALADSIRATGVIQPIVVRRLPDDGFELVAGERRWRAAQRAGLTVIPAIVKEVSDTECMELALIENIQREDLNAIDRARAYQQYLDTCKVGVEALAKRLGESRPSVANYLRLLKLSDDILEMVRNGELPMGQARAIAGLDDPEHQRRLARLAVRRGLSTRQVEALVATPTAEPADGGEEATKGKANHRHLQELERALSQSLGVRVTLRPGRGKHSGAIVIRYRNLDEFDQLAAKLGLKQPWSD